MKFGIFICKLCLVVSSMYVISCNSYQSSQTTGSIKCTLKGEVKDRPKSKKLLLVKQGEDPRINAVYIPIKKGKFEYVLYCDFEEQYDLIFDDEYKKGSITPVPFFSEQGDINFTLYPESQFNRNIVEGGNNNREYWDFIKERLKIYETIQPEIDEAQKNRKKIEGELRAKLKQVDEETQRWTLQYINEHSTIVTYSILFSKTSSIIQRNKYFSESSQDISPYVNLYQTIFAPKFQEHPYTERMEELLKGLLVKAGIPFIDFSAVDMGGKSVKLSERIAGKPAVLHLWASWCGPCRSKGKELISVYEEFHDKGFVVIGVARERDNFSAAEAAIKLDKYPWENLVELNDTEKVWVKYGIGNAGGSEFLIDEKGTIVAVAPSIDEIRDFLQKYYNSK